MSHTPPWIHPTLPPPPHPAIPYPPLPHNHVEPASPTPEVEEAGEATGAPPPPLPSPTPPKVPHAGGGSRVASPIPPRPGMHRVLRRRGIPRPDVSAVPPLPWDPPRRRKLPAASPTPAPDPAPTTALPPNHGEGNHAHRPLPSPSLAGFVSPPPRPLNPKPPTDESVGAWKKRHEEVSGGGFVPFLPSLIPPPEDPVDRAEMGDLPHLPTPREPGVTRRGTAIDAPEAPQPGSGGVIPFISGQAPPPLAWEVGPFRPPPPRWRWRPTDED